MSKTVAKNDKASGMMFCVPKQPPRVQLVEAAKVAWGENPTNRPAQARGLLSADEASPEAVLRIVLDTTRYWGETGVSDLSVGFMESIPTGLRDRILGQANRWSSKRANIRFRWTQDVGSAIIRVTREAHWGGGYWSYVGTDNKLIDAGEPTLCLQGFSNETPEAEFLRVVPHKFGHALGFPHEHARREVIELLHLERTVRWFRRNYGWSRTDVIAQVFNPLEEGSAWGTERPDLRSAMCYDFPGECTKSGEPIPGGLDLSESDLTFAALVYPPGSAPPPNERGPVVVLVGYDAKNQEVARYRRE